MVVFKSNRNIYAQIINDVEGRTLVSTSSLSEEIKSAGSNNLNVALAKQVGVAIGKKATAFGIKSVVFDRNGNLYHGRIKALADGARESGLIF